MLTADPAFPPISGADLRNYQNASAAAGFGDVLLVSVRPTDRTETPDSRIRIAALTRRDEPKGQSIRHLRTSVETRVPRAAPDRLRDLVTTFRPDTIIVEGIQLGALLSHLRPLTGRLILDMHNVESLLASQVRPAKPLLRGWGDPARIERQEREALEMVDRVWVCSDSDREKLLGLFAPAIPVDVVPNGIPRFDLAPASLPVLAGKEEGWPVMLFVGHLGYQPNVLAAERLARAVLPLVRLTLPLARLILAGRYPKPEVRDLVALPGVELVENPEDLSPLFAMSHMCVMPLSAGGGTRIKILEAMAWGLPVVATTVAAEGQGLTDGREILIAGTDEGLAGHVVALCSEPGRMERHRSLAYEEVMRRFGPSVIEAAVRTGLEA